MKKSIYYLALIASGFMFSCTQRSTNSESGDSLKNGLTDIGDQCFAAIHEKDSADLKIRTAADGKVTGSLVINFGELKPNSLENVLNKGEIAGNYHGDTLFVTYTYTSGTINKTIYSNPLAFLKKGDKLILGVGDIETTMGRSYFIKDKPINFDIARFQFEPIDCKN